jgi:hypothetical protein
MNNLRIEETVNTSAQKDAALKLKPLCSRNGILLRGCPSNRLALPEQKV